MTEQGYRAALVRIDQLVEAWMSCDCTRPCNACLDRIHTVQELARAALGNDEQ